MFRFPSIILFLALSVFTQDFAPDWLKESWRTSHFPKSEWYTGFAMDKVEGQPNSKMRQTIERQAQSKLSESIIVRYQSTAAIQTASQQTQKGESIYASYEQNIKTTSDIILAKVDVNSYFDKTTGEIYAFATIKKKELADFYRSNINFLFSFAEKELIIAEQLAEQGKKNSAFNKIRAIEDSLKSVRRWGLYLQSVELDYSYIQQEKDLWLKANNAKAGLENGTLIYLDVYGVKDSGFFAELLGAQMQEKQCNCAIAKSQSSADYVVKINAKLSHCNESEGIVFCYANANATINNPKYKNPVNVKIPDAKGGWGDREKAAEETFNKLANNIAEKIVQSINQ